MFEDSKPKEYSATSPTLIEKVKNSDDNIAWARFYQKYKPIIRSAASRHGLRPDEVDEVLQTVMGKVGGKIGDFIYQKEKGGFRNWIRTIVRFTAIDILRKRSRKEMAEVQLPADDELEVEEVDDSAVQELAELRGILIPEAMKIVRAKVNISSDNARILSALYNGQSAKDISAATGFKAQAVHNVLHRYREVFEEAVKEVWSKLTYSGKCP